uniref:Uncharacterized protein n=1 Tax=Steinernema glaseri TaxID=37863 RepID=A0A1I7YUG1_9BILA
MNRRHLRLLLHNMPAKWDRLWREVSTGGRLLPCEGAAVTTSVSWPYRIIKEKRSQTKKLKFYHTNT